MPSSHQRRPRIRFDGDWPATDRGRVREAIERADLLTPWNGAPSVSGEVAWLCIHRRCEDGSFYFAHWLHRPLVLNAPSIEALIDELAALTADDSS